MEGRPAWASSYHRSLRPPGLLLILPPSLFSRKQFWEHFLMLVLFIYMLPEHICIRSRASGFNRNDN